MIPAPGEWERLRLLCADLESGRSPRVDEDLRDYLRKVALQTGHAPDVVAQLSVSDRGLFELAREARKRVRLGSRRLMAAMSAADNAVLAGNADAARTVLYEVVDNEPVPLYRDQARLYLRGLGLSPTGE